MEQYLVTGMSCAACSARVEKAVNKVPGVTSCSVSLLTNSMGVEGTASPQDIIAAVDKAGYGASLKRSSKAQASGAPSARSVGITGAPAKSSGLEHAGSPGLEGAGASSLTASSSWSMDPGPALSTGMTGDSDLDALADHETPVLRRRLIASLCFLIPLMYVSMGHMMFGWPLPGFFDNNHVAMGIVQMLLASIVMVINQKFFISGFRSIWYRAPNMDSLVALGASASYAWSVYTLLAMTRAQVDSGASGASAYMDGFYFEGAAMILTLITVGKMLEARSKGRTTDALKGLMKLAPKEALLVRDGQEISVPVEMVQVGDIFAVRPGASVPVDGMIIEGNTALNEASLTGESIPVDKTVGDPVSSATINQSGYIRCRATRVGQDTTLSQIIQLVSDAAATKAPIAKIADKVSGVFVPVVIGIAIVTIIVWLLVGQEAGFALARGIAVLVISCPCALGLATPVAIMVGNGKGAKNGILFKTASALEETGKVSSIVLDKTGTITRGEPQVTDVLPAKELSPDELIAFAYALEKRSEHPLAKAIVDEAAKISSTSSQSDKTQHDKTQSDLIDPKDPIPDSVLGLDIEDFVVIPGKGVAGKVCIDDLPPDIIVSLFESCGGAECSFDTGRAFIIGGNPALIREHAAIPADAEEEIQILADEGKTPMLFAICSDLDDAICSDLDDEVTHSADRETAHNVDPEQGSTLQADAALTDEELADSAPADAALTDEELADSAPADAVLTDEELADAERQGMLLGVIAVADTIKPDSAEAVRDLAELGIEVSMLTGDNERTANAIAKQAGISHVMAGVLPEGKQDAVAALMEKGKVAMVGDGINDAPALTKANIGIAIGAGSDIAMDAADVVLVKSNLADVPAAVRLSRAVLRNIKQNLFWAFIYNIIGIPLAAGVYYHAFGWTLNPMICAAAMSLSSFCVVTNALRLNTFKVHRGSADKPAVDHVQGGEERCAPVNDHDPDTIKTLDSSMIKTCDPNSVNDHDPNTINETEATSQSGTISESGITSENSQQAQTDHLTIKKENLTNETGHLTTTKEHLTTKDKEEKETMEKRNMEIEGMMCMHCEARVKKALEAVDGVASAEVSHEQNSAVVTLEKEVSDDILKAAVEEQDYEVKSIA